MFPDDLLPVLSEFCGWLGALIAWVCGWLGTQIAWVCGSLGGFLAARFAAFISACKWLHRYLKVLFVIVSSCCFLFLWMTTSLC